MTTFKQQPALRLALPESSQAQKSGANENPPVVVSIDEKGLLRFGPNADVVTPDQLNERLQESARKNADTKLAVRADKKAPWESIVKVMDLAKAAKIKSMSAYTKDAGKP